MPRIRIDSTWLTAAIGIAAAGVALMYPEAGIVLIVAAVVVLLFGVRIEGWHVRLMPTWRSRVHTWGPWILIIGGPVLGTLWLVFRPPIAGPIAWNFQKTGYAIQLEWALERVGGPLKFYVPGFIFHGENGSEPLYQVKAFVTIDQNKKVIPLYIAVDGQWIQFSQIEGIPAGRTVDIGCQMRSDGPHCEGFPDRISPEQFLNDLGGFTLTFSHDGETPKNWHCSSVQLRQQFEKQKREAEEQIKTNPRLQPSIKKVNQRRRGHLHPSIYGYYIRSKCYWK